MTDSVNKRKCLLFDIDGVLIDTPHWEDLYPSREFDFDVWAEAARDKQSINMKGLDLLTSLVSHHSERRSMHCPDYPDVILLTGRMEKFRALTFAPLDDYWDDYWELLMRPDLLHFENMPDDKFKEFVLHTKILPHYDVALAVDDRASICKMYEQNGIPTIMMVNKYSFER